MAPVPADAFITCRVSRETKSLLRQLAEREGINESALLKQLLDVLLRTSGGREATPIDRTDRIPRGGRLYVRVSADDRQLLKERAARRGVASATYVALLVRAHLRAAAPVPKAEYLALRQSVLELSAIGRNLNQIAKALHQGDKAAVPGRAGVLAMVKLAEGLRDNFKKLLKANEISWRGHAETHH